MTEDEAKPSTGEKTTVFISDPSVEAERITQALRGAEFHVVDVPLAMLVARVAVQRPRVVILDADADGALDAVARMRELPDAESIDVLFVGRPGAALSNAEDALAHEGSGFFPRPVNVPTLTKKVESLVLGEVEHSSAPPAPPHESNPPPSPSAPSRPPSQRPSRPPSMPPSRPPSVPPASLRPASQRMAQPSIVSRELQQLLSRAEERVADEGPASDAPVPSPEEEIQAVLPEDVLAALDAPLEGADAEDEIEGGPSRVTTSGGRSATTGVREPVAPPAPRAPSMPPDPLTHDGSPNAHQTQGEPPMSTTGTGAPRTEGGSTVAHRFGRPRSEPAPPPSPSPAAAPQPFGVDPSSVVTTPPPPRRLSSLPPPTHMQASPSALSTTLGSEMLMQHGGMIAAPPLAPFGQPAPSTRAQSSGPMPLSPAPATFEDPRESRVVDSPAASRAAASLQNRSVRAETAQEAEAQQGPYALGPGDAPRVLAQAIAARQTGSLTFETPAPTGTAVNVRRIVLREGDVVTAASGVDTESLLAFLGARGDLPRERVEALSGRLPPYGRHAGAALVAQGALGQEQLWPVLRAHAEYLMGQAMLVSSGTALLEPDPPGRLKTEPSVFGGAPGAEIFVEVVRRTIASDEAIRRCGGTSSVVAEGPRDELLRECGLGAAEFEAIQSARGQRLDALVESFPDTDIASVLYALWLLGVVEMVRSVLERAPREARGPDVIDEEAIRDRVRARLQLVDEGDYFALLGVPHNATGYEVRRAYLDLRRAFEPSRLLTPGLVDLAEDVRRIAGVLEEAYEILGDNARRERYRRAIDASPDAR